MDVFVRPQEVEKLAGVAEPEGKAGGVKVPWRTLNDVSDNSGDSGQHVGQSHGPDLRYDVWPVEGGGSEPSGHVEDVGGGELEVDEGRVQLGDDGREEVVFGLVTELQNCRQDLLLSVPSSSPVLTLGHRTFPGALPGLLP